MTVTPETLAAQFAEAETQRDAAQAALEAFEEGVEEKLGESRRVRSGSRVPQDGVGLTSASVSGSRCESCPARVRLRRAAYPTRTR